MNKAIKETNTDTKIKNCVSIEDWEWKDCDLEGHDEGCFMLVCPDCGTKDRDCEYGGASAY